MLTSLYFFGNKENWTWGKDAIFDSMNNSTDVVVVIKEFANINKNNAVPALDDFLDEENEDWDLFFWSKFLKDWFEMMMKNKWMHLLRVYYSFFVLCLL